MCSNLHELWEEAWRQLALGQSEANHPYRTPVVSTISTAGPFANNFSLHPRSRTIVLRECSQEHGELYCYTDRRAQKALDINNGNPLMSWTFWAPKQRIQFTGWGPTNWLEEEKAKERFQRLPKHARKAYATVKPPGTLLSSAESNLPDDWNQLSLAATDYVFANFGVLRTKLRYAEVLLLDRKKHLRLGASRVDEKWELQWMVP